MSRNKKRRRKPVIPTTWIGWSKAWAEVFSLVPAEWAPPSQVRACWGKRHVTFTARFFNPDGYHTTATVRAEIDAAGNAYVVSERLKLTIAVGAFGQKRAELVEAA